MRYTRVLVATMVASAIAFGGTAGASAAPSDNPRAACAAPGMVGNDPENDFFPKVGGCVSSVATGGLESGELSRAGYVQRCKQLEGLFGGYPMMFEHGERIDIANNKQECVALLQFFHGGGLG